MDRDIQETVSRSQFESLCEPLVARMKEVLSEVMSAAPTCCSFSNLKVEIIGGAVRVPFVQTAIKEACGVETLHVSLDSATAVSSGAALYGVNGLTGTANVAKLPTGRTCCASNDTVHAPPYSFPSPPSSSLRALTHHRGEVSCPRRGDCGAGHALDVPTR